QHGTDLAGRGLDVGEVGRAVLALGGGDAEVGELGLGCGLGGAHHERQAPLAAALGGESPEAVLDDGDLAPGEPRHLLLVDVGADHGVSERRETGSRGETHVAGADDCDGVRHGAQGYRWVSTAGAEGSPTRRSRRRRRLPAKQRWCSSSLPWWSWCWCSWWRMTWWWPSAGPRRRGRRGPGSRGRRSE